RQRLCFWRCGRGAVGTGDLRHVHVVEEDEEVIAAGRASGSVLRAEERFRGLRVDINAVADFDLRARLDVGGAGPAEWLDGDPLALYRPIVVRWCAGREVFGLPHFGQPVDVEAELGGQGVRAI